jgi:hypothetical protein
VSDPTNEEAMSAYLAAAAHEYVVPVDAISDTRHLYAAIEWPRAGGVMWRIINPSDLTDDGRLMPAIAVCSYDQNKDWWLVELFEVNLREPKTFTVQKVDGRFMVVAIDKPEWTAPDNYDVTK